MYAGAMAPMIQRVNSTQTSIKCGQCKMVLQLPVNVDKLGSMLRVITSQRKQLNGLEINAIVLCFAARMTSISPFLKPKLR